MSCPAMASTIPMKWYFSLLNCAISGRLLAVYQGGVLPFSCVRQSVRRVTSAWLDRLTKFVNNKYTLTATFQSERSDIS